MHNFSKPKFSNLQNREVNIPAVHFLLYHNSMHDNFKSWMKENNSLLYLLAMSQNSSFIQEDYSFKLNLFQTDCWYKWFATSAPLGFTIAPSYKMKNANSQFNCKDWKRFQAKDSKYLCCNDSEAEWLRFRFSRLLSFFNL